MKIGLATFLACMGLSVGAFAQDYGKDAERLNKVEGTQKENPKLASCPLKTWIGERFVFLPKPVASSFRPVYGHFQAGEELFSQPQYEDYVGKMVEAVRVHRLDDRWEVEFEVLDSGKRLVATAWSGGISGIAPVRDIRVARERWLGKTLWFKKERLHSCQNAEGNKDWLRVRPGTSVKVIDVVPGSDHNTPVRFILETPAGKKGYVDLAWSRMNVYPSAWRYCDKFSSFFFTRDPSKALGVLASGS